MSGVHLLCDGRVTAAALLRGEGVLMMAMRRVAGLALAGAVALASVTVTPTEGWASSVWPTVGSLSTSISAPSTAHAGSTYSFSVTLSQASPDTMLLDGTLVTIWLPADNSAYTATHNKLMWLNPSTNIWQSPTSVDNSTGQYEFDLGPLTSWLRLPPHKSLTFRFQVSLASSLPAGTYHVFPQDAWAYELVDSAGKSVQADLDTPDVQTTFTIGGGSNGSGGSGTSGGSHKSGSGTAAASQKAANMVAPSKSPGSRPSPSPAAVHSSPAASPSGAMTPNLTPTFTPTRTPTPSAVGAFEPVASASHGSRTAAIVLWPLAFVLMLGVSAAYVMVLRRRRRAHGGAGD